MSYIQDARGFYATGSSRARPVVGADKARIVGS